MCCHTTNRGLVIGLLVSSIILFILSIIYVSIYPWKWVWRIELVKILSIIRVVMASFSLATAILMVINRVKGKNSHKQAPCISIEKGFSICCLIFSIILAVTCWICNGTSISRMIADPRVQCMYRCLVSSTYLDGSINYVCGGEYPIYDCERYNGPSFPIWTNGYWLEAECGDLYSCTLAAGKKDITIRSLADKLRGVVIIGVIEAIYWIVMIAEWSFMVKYIRHGNTESYKDFTPVVVPASNATVVVVPGTTVQPQYVPASSYSYPQQQYTVGNPVYPQSQNTGSIAPIQYVVAPQQQVLGSNVAFAPTPKIA